MVCSHCSGDGWYTDHSDECYVTGECTESEGCPVQRPCERCHGEDGDVGGTEPNPIPF